MSSSSKDGTERSGSIKGEKFLGQLNDYQILKKGPVPSSYYHFKNRI
jgi:hypothetical protein